MRDKIKEVLIEKVRPALKKAFPGFDLEAGQVQLWLDVLCKENVTDMDVCHGLASLERKSGSKYFPTLDDLSVASRAARGRRLEREAELRNDRDKREAARTDQAAILERGVRQVKDPKIRAQMERTRQLIRQEITPEEWRKG